MKNTHRIAILVAMAFAEGHAYAEEGFFSTHYVGVSYTATKNYAAISYNAPNVPKPPSDCQTSDHDSSVMNCKANLGPDTSGSGSSFSVFIERPFKRQGLFYFEPGFTFSTISYQGGLTTKPTSALSNGNKSTTPEETTMADGRKAPGATQPLTSAHMSMYGLNLQSYLRFGLTPLYIPDILFTVGLGMQTVAGKLKIFDQNKTRYVVQPEIFGELEIVLARASGGFLSVFLGQDQTLVSQVGSRLIEDHPSGTNLTNFQLSLVAGSAGVRVLFPF